MKRLLLLLLLSTPALAQRSPVLETNLDSLRKRLVGSWYQSDAPTTTQVAYFADGTFSANFVTAAGVHKTSHGTWYVAPTMQLCIEFPEVQPVCWRVEMLTEDTKNAYTGYLPRQYTLHRPGSFQGTFRLLK